MNRWVSWLLISVIFLGCFVEKVQADQWFDSYDNAMKALQEKNWTLAESQLVAAKTSGPKQGRHIRAYGIRYIDYLPDYYLGVVYFNQGKYSQAIQQFDLAKNAGLVKEGDAQYAQMVTMVEGARQELAKPSEDVQSKQKEFDSLMAQANQSLAARDFVKARDQAKHAAATGINNQKANDLLTSIDQAEATALKDQDRRSQFNSLMDDANRALAQKNYTRARDLAGKAGLLNVDQSRVDKLLTSISVEENKLPVNSQKQQVDLLLSQANQAVANKNYALARELVNKARAGGYSDTDSLHFLNSIEITERTDELNVAMNGKDWNKARAALKILAKIDSNNPTWKKYQAQIDKAQTDTHTDTTETEKLEYSGLMLFYKGQYQQSIAVLERVVQKDEGSAIAQFYLGCGNAAIALLAGATDGKEMLVKARSHFGKVRQIRPDFQIDDKFISPRILEIYQQTR